MDQVRRFYGQICSDSTDCSHVTGFYLSAIKAGKCRVMDGIVTPQIHMLKSYPSIPQNVTLCGDRAFKM